MATCKGKFGKWRMACIERDGRRCIMCGLKEDNHRGRHVCVHHKAPTSKYPTIEHDPRNGVSLCRICHDYVHSPAGKTLCDLWERDAAQLSVVACRRTRSGGKAPTGFKFNDAGRTLIPDEGQAGGVVAVFKLYMEGCSLEEIGARTNRLPNSVRAMLRSPAHRGLWRGQNGESYVTPPIVPADIVAEVDRILSVSDGKPMRWRSAKAMLAGILKCGECGSWLNAHCVSDRNDATKRYYSYHCSVCRSSYTSEKKILKALAGKVPCNHDKASIGSTVDHILFDRDNPENSDVVLVHAPAVSIMGLS